MRYLSFAIICLLSAALGGCETQQEAKQESVVQKPLPMTAPEGDILTLGREISQGSVDIYEPGTSRVDVPPIATFTPRPSPVPDNSNIIVRDPDVTVYSLDADPSALPAENLERAPAPPAAPPRQYAPELTPVPDPQAALPNLQPPVAARGQYASPFMATAPQ